jgi:hypothetical protein
MRLRGLMVERGERGNSERETPDSFSVEGAPKRSESPRKQEVPVRIKPSDSKEGHGLPDGRKPLKRRCQAREVWQESVRAERKMGNHVSTIG